MRLNHIFITLTLLISTSGYGQADSLSISRIQEKFKSFEYVEVIRHSEMLLRKKQNLSNEALIELHQMRAISYYSMDSLTLAINAFSDILNINSEFQFDPVKTSPKIIAFFDGIRLNLATAQDTDALSTNRAQSDSLAFFLAQSQVNNKLRSVMARSILLPGWGHLHRGNRTKGWILTIASVTAVSSAIYFFDDSRTKEKAYLNETDLSKTDARYDAFNSAFKKRNVVMVAYALIWLYAQADLLIFSRSSFAEFPISAELSKLHIDSPPELRVSLQIPLLQAP